MGKKLCITALINCLALAAMAQEARNTEVAVSLTTEGGYNMTNDKANWVNLLEVGIGTKLNNRVALTSDLIAIHNTRSQREKGGISEDLQVFSNIEDENRALSVFSFGLTWLASPHFNAFAGVRNVNLDYFTSPMTTVFTGSSQGIYPTLSENWTQLANYPLSAICMHLEWMPDNNWHIKTSLYNGVASHEVTEAFRFRPKRDGIFYMAQLGYVEPESSGRALGEYYIGVAYGNATNEEGEKKSQHTVYGLVEQPLIGKRLGLLLEGSAASRTQACHAYFGAGIVLGSLLKEDDRVGAMVNRALYAEGRETDIELTYCVPITTHITVQPCLHFIRTSGRSNKIGMLRLNISL